MVVAASLPDFPLHLRPRESAQLCAQCRIVIGRYVFVVAGDMDFRCRTGNRGDKFVRRVDTEIERVLASINVGEGIIVVLGSKQVVVTTAVDDMRALMSEAHIAAARAVPVH